MQKSTYSVRVWRVVGWNVYSELEACKRGRARDGVESREDGIGKTRKLMDRELNALSNKYHAEEVGDRDGEYFFVRTVGG